MKLDGGHELLAGKLRRAVDSYLPRNCNETFPRSETMRKLLRIDFHPSLSLSPSLSAFLRSFFSSFLSVFLFFFLRGDGNKWSGQADQASDIQNSRGKVSRAWITKLNRRMLIAGYHACDARWILTRAHPDDWEREESSIKSRARCFARFARQLEPVAIDSGDLDFTGKVDANNGTIYTPVWKTVLREIFSHLEKWKITCETVQDGGKKNLCYFPYIWNIFNKK